MKQAAYIKGAVKITDIPDEKPIILFLGRSNVGKSSLINSLTNRKNLAHTSGTPGKTMLLNFYLINNEFYLVDAPGYGYARRSKKMLDDFIIMIEDILLKRSEEHTSELQSRPHLVCRLLLEKKKKNDENIFI